MELERTQSFQRDYKKLPSEIKRRAEQALRFLASNPRHPSLEARIVDKSRRIGAHDVMERPQRW